MLNGAVTPPDSTAVGNKLEVAANYTARVAAGCAYGTEQIGVATLAEVTWNLATVYATKAAIDSRCRAPGSARLGTAIEYYSAKLKHYLVTAYTDEVAALDALPGANDWRRTGGEFTVYRDPAPGVEAVCRFSRTPGTGPVAHLYAVDAAQCASLKSQPQWTYDGVAFHLPLPVGGQCGADYPVYRSYFTDNVADAKHRLTVDLTAHVRMNSRRGDLLEGIVLCAPVTDAEREADVVRFLEQATLGQTEALVQEVKAKGISKWLDEQVPMNITRHSQWPLYARTRRSAAVHRRHDAARHTGEILHHEQGVALAGGLGILQAVEACTRPAPASHGTRLASDLRRQRGQFDVWLSRTTSSACATTRSELSRIC